jgi:hypothetical protein
MSSLCFRGAGFESLRLSLLWVLRGLGQDMATFLIISHGKYLIYSVTSRPPLWSSAHSSWLQIQRSRVRSVCYQIFLEVIGLKRGPLSLMRIIEELLERTVAAPV